MWVSSRVRTAVSLVEVLLAVAILASGATSIFWVLSSSRGQWLRQDAAVVSRLLATSILEQAVHRFRAQDTRYFTVLTAPDEITRRAGWGRWKDPFLALARTRTKVLSPPGVQNPYFTGDSAPVLPVPFDPDERALWDRFSYEVTASFEMVDGGGSRPLDADRDGHGNVDLGRLEALVYFRPAEDLEDRLACRLTTLIAAHDRPPGAAALAEP